MLLISVVLEKRHPSKGVSSSQDNSPTGVAVKCRQNKLFISRYFNPVHPCIANFLTALTAKCSTERSHISKEGRGKLFLSVEVQNLRILLL